MKSPLIKHIPLLFLLFILVAAFAQSQSDPSRSRLILRETAQKASEGNPEALYQMSVVYSRGFDSIPKDIHISDSLLRRAAEAGHIPAANLLAFRLMEGKEMPPDTIEAIRLFEIAANAGDAKAQSNLGYLLTTGIGVEPDPEKGAYWLTLAAEAGLSQAQSMLGDLYRDGRGVERDSLLAEANYRSALEHGLTDAGSKLFDIRRATIDSLPDYERLAEALYFYKFNAIPPAILLLTSLEESPDSVVRAHSYALLGDAYARSRGVKYDYEKSMDYLFNAASLGNPSAAFMIGELLDMLPDALKNRLPKDAPTDLQYAQYWYDVAAHAGISDAAEANRRLRNPPLR